MKYLGLSIALLGLAIILTGCEREPIPVPQYGPMTVVCMTGMNTPVLIETRWHNDHNGWNYAVIFETGEDQIFGELMIEPCE